MPQIILAHQTFSYSVKKKSIRSIRLHLESANSFLITCPYLTPAFLIEKFIKQNRDWILKNSQKIKPEIKLKNLSFLNILDHQYQVLSQVAPKDLVVINHEKCQIYLYTPTLTQKHLKIILYQNLKILALSLISRELQKLKQEFKFEFKKVTVRNQKSRFGSCSSRGNLNFNWQIIFFPPDKFRHILLHELTHLTHHNHSKSFWQALSVSDPYWKSNNAWLKKEGVKSFLF